MTEASVALATVVGQLQGEVRVMDGKVDDLSVRMAVLERVAITPAKLTLILTVSGGVASAIFGGITALVVVFHH